jgi:hypothetical protein
VLSWTKESKQVVGRGFSLTVRIPVCTDNINRGKPVLEPSGVELSKAGGNPKVVNTAADNKTSPWYFSMAFPCITCAQ